MQELPAPSRLMDIPWRKVLPIFLALSLPLIICVAIFISIHTRETVRYNIDFFRQQQQTEVERADSLLHQELGGLSTEILTFTNSPNIRHLLANPQDQDLLKIVNVGLSNLVQNKKRYEQIRVLDNNGRELVRVEKRDKQAVIIPREELESRAQDAFSNEALQLQVQGQIAFSPMELARDQKGEIKRPFHPLFHLATPIFDQHLHKVGILLFTYKGQSIFDIVTNSTNYRHISNKNLSSSKLQVVNNEGVWLLAPDKEDEWGFVRDSQRRFDLRFPEPWKAMHEQGQGQITTPDGLFTFTTISLVAGTESSRAPGTEAKQDAAPFWFLLSQVSPEDLAHINTQTRRSHLILFLIVVLSSLPLLLWITLLLQKQKENKKQLQAQEQRFRLLYDKAPLPYQSLDQKGLLLDINQAWLTALGYSRSEVTGRWFGDFVMPHSLALLQESFQFLSDKDEITHCELELLKKDGSTLLASFHFERSSDDQGSYVQTHCIFVDITELQAEKQQTAHLSILLQTIIQIHRLIDQENEQQELAQGCCDILVDSRGYGSAWIILLDSDEKIKNSAEAGLLHDREQLKDQIEQGTPPPCIRECRTQHGMMVIDTPATFCSACPMKGSYPRKGIMCAALSHKSSTYGYINVSLLSDFMQDQEEKDLFSEIARDIGYALFNLEQQEKKKQTDISLRQSEERLRGITDSAQDAILMMDSQGAITFWNPASEKILGYQAEEVLGKDLHTLLAPLRYQAAHQAAFPGFLRSGHGNAIGKTIELSALRKDGREIPVTLSLSALLQDEKWQAVGILRDMTERKRMEEQMLQAEKMSTIAGLAAGVAHEINTPLSAILQSIQVIRQSLSPDLARNQEIASHYALDLAKVQDYFEKRDINFFMDGIRESAIKSGKIITNLLQFSRPQKGENSREDLALLLDKSVDLAKNDYELKKKCNILNVEIVREYSPNLPQVSCVAMDIEQVFINLLKNAAQAMADRTEPLPKARIILRTLLHGEMVRVEIEDNGPGMDEATRIHIFDPFFTTKDVGVGTGLGLSVSYTIIVTKHGGKLTVQSRPGQGTTMTIDLPIHHQNPTAASEVF